MDRLTKRPLIVNVIVRGNIIIVARYLATVFTFANDRSKRDPAGSDGIHKIASRLPASVIIIGEFFACLSCRIMMTLCALRHFPGMAGREGRRGGWRVWGEWKKETSNARDTRFL